MKNYISSVKRATIDLTSDIKPQRDLKSAIKNEVSKFENGNNRLSLDSNYTANKK